MAAADERVLPGAVGVVVGAWVARLVQQRASDPAADRRGHVEDGVHPLVGRERLPLTIPSAAICPARSGSSAPAGSSCTIVLISSKKPKSFEWVPLKDTPAKLMNSISGGIAAADSG